MKDGFPTPAPTPNDCGPRDSNQTYRLLEAIAKPIVRGNLDNGDRGTPMRHVTMPNKVVPTALVAPPQNEIVSAPYTSGKPSKPAGRPLPMTGGRR